MNESKRLHLTGSAVRICVAHNLLQMEARLNLYHQRLAISVSSSEQLDWKYVLECGERVITYLRNCQSEASTMEGFVTRGVHGLSAVDAAQDALLAALAHANASRLGDGQYKRYLNSTIQCHTLRSKCLVNAIVSLNSRDSGLAQLWEEAAQYIQQQSQLRRKESRTKVWSMGGVFERLLSPYRVPSEYIPSASDSADVQELNALADRCHRLCGVYSVMERKTDYLYAANTYLQAVKHIRESEKCTADAVKLWAAAGSSARLAAELIEAQALNNTAAQDPLVSNALATAARFAADAQKLHSNNCKLSSLKVKHSRYLKLLSDCNNTQVQRALHLLIESQLALVRSWERYDPMVKDCESTSPVAVELLGSFDAAATKLTGLSATADALELNINRAAFYRASEQQSRHIANDSLRALWHQCWRSSSVQTERVIDYFADIIVTMFGDIATFEEEKPVPIGRLLARLYVFCITDIVNVGVEYFNSARGANSKNCDPREAQWWKEAGEHQTKCALLYMSELDDITNVQPDSDTHVPVISQAVSDLAHTASRYATAAEYLQRATSTHPPGNKNITELYELAATLIVAQLRCKGALVTIYNRAELCCVELVDVTTGIVDADSDNRVHTLKACCEYARNFFVQCEEAAGRWREAFNAAFPALPLWRDGRNEEARIALALAALHATGANASGTKSSRDSAAVRVAVHVLSDSTCVAVDVSNYRMALAQRVCSHFTESKEAPADLMQLALSVDPRAQCVLDEHFVACEMAIECNLEISLIAAGSSQEKVWLEALAEFDRWHETFLLIVCELLSPVVNSSLREDLAHRSKLHNVSLVAYMTAARSLAPEWDDAVAMCRETRECWCYNEAAEAIECYVSAAFVVLEGDTALAGLWREAAAVARELVLHLESTAPVQREVLDCKLQAANHRVLSLIARRSGQMELSHVLDQIADLSLELMAVIHPPAANRSSQALQGEWTERREILEQIGRLKCIAKVLSTTQTEPAALVSPFVTVLVPVVHDTATQCIVSGWIVQVGDIVAANEVLTVVERGQKTELVCAPCAGKVARIYVEEGARVEAGEPVMCIKPF